MRILYYRKRPSIHSVRIGLLLTILILVTAAWLKQPTPETTQVHLPTPDRSLTTEESVQDTVATVIQTDAKPTKSEPVQTDKPLRQEKRFEPIDIPLSAELQEYTASLCAQWKVPYALALAVIEHESNFDVDAIHQNTNGTTDSGLMQLNDIVAGQVKAAYSVTDLMDPKQNLRAGIGILSDYLSRHSVSDTVMAYINGENGMLRLKESGVTSTPSAEKVLALMQKYERLLGTSAEDEQFTEQIV